MLGPLKVPVRTRDSVDQDLEILQVPLEPCRRRPSYCLIHFRHCLDAMGPGDWRFQRNPLDHSTRNDVTLASQRLLSHHPLERILQMAEHLVGSHPAPMPLIVGSDIAQPSDDLLLHCRIGQNLHHEPPRSSTVRLRLPMGTMFRAAFKRLTREAVMV